MIQKANQLNPGGLGPGEPGDAHAPLGEELLQHLAASAPRPCALGR